MAEREFELTLFGGTGFTGALTAQYLSENAPADLRWALAGRNRQKLEALRDRLGVDVELLHADAEDAASLRDVAARSGVVATTVGPYLLHGEPLVAACAAEGTDYTDLTGEPEFVDRMYVNHHARAIETGARIIHACGFDSIPHDLGVLFTVKQRPEGVPLRVEGLVRAGGTFSSGTYASAITQFSRARDYAKVAKQRKQIEERPSDRRVRGDKGKPHRVNGVWAIPFPTVDPQIILRSARALDRYGPDFTYGHYVGIKRLPVALGGAAGVAGLFTLAQIPPAKSFLLGRVKPGSGPSDEKRASSWFKLRFEGEGGGERVVCEVRGGDPGYTETAKMLAEASMSLARDDLPETAGQVTTAQAMGDALTDRLTRAGITFETVDRL
jgi:saccharopine dehydrogenase (NAD+, L-glutamate forming)